MLNDMPLLRSNVARRGTKIKSKAGQGAYEPKPKRGSASVSRDPSCSSCSSCSSCRFNSFEMSKYKIDALFKTERGDKLNSIQNRTWTCS